MTITLRQAAARGIKWQAIEVGGRLCLSLGVFTALARLLQPTDFGLVAVVSTYLALINMVVDQGMSTALVQRRDLQAAHLDTAFWFSLGWALALFAVTVLAGNSLASFAGAPTAGRLLRWAALGILVNASTTVHSALLVKHMDFRFLALRTVVANAVGGGLGVVLALAGFGVWSLVWQQLVTLSVAAIVLWVISPWRPAMRFSPRHLSELMRVGASVFSANLLWNIASRIDQLIIGRFAGPFVLGQYAVGVKLAEMAKGMIYEPIAAVAMPALSRVQGDHERLRNALYSAIELHAIVCFAVFGGLASVAPSVVPLVFGMQWGSAGTILQFVAVYSLIISLSVFFHPALLASGGIQRYVFVNLICAVGAVTACLVGIRFGVHTLIALLIVNVLFSGALALSFLHRRIGLDVSRYCRACAVPAAAFALMFAAVTLTRVGPAKSLPLWIRTAAEVCIGAVAYLSVLWTFSAPRIVRLWDTMHSGLAPVRPPREQNAVFSSRQYS